MALGGIPEISESETLLTNDCKSNSFSLCRDVCVDVASIDNLSCIVTTKQPHQIPDTHETCWCSVSFGFCSHVDWPFGKSTWLLKSPLKNGYDLLLHPVEIVTKFHCCVRLPEGTPVHSDMVLYMSSMRIGYPLHLLGIFLTNNLDLFVISLHDIRYTSLAEQLWWDAPRQESNSGPSIAWRDWSWRRPIALRASSIPIPCAYSPIALLKERFLDFRHEPFWVGQGRERKERDVIMVRLAEWHLYPSIQPSIHLWTPCVHQTGHIWNLYLFFGYGSTPSRPNFSTLRAPLQGVFLRSCPAAW